MKKYIPNHPKFDSTLKHPNWTFFRMSLFWMIKELLKTFSNEPSFFSSKRIERALIFVNANICLDICIKTLLNNDKITVETAIALYVTQMIYVGYSTTQTFKEKKQQQEVDNDANKDNLG